MVVAAVGSVDVVDEHEEVVEVEGFDPEEWRRGGEAVLDEEERSFAMPIQEYPWVWEFAPSCHGEVGVRERHQDVDRGQEKRF